jgi:hypothetical protein
MNMNMQNFHGSYPWGALTLKTSGEDEDKRRKKMSKVRILGSNLLLSEIGSARKPGTQASDHGRTDQQYRIEYDSELTQ